MNKIVFYLMACGMLISCSMGVNKNNQQESERTQPNHSQTSGLEDSSEAQTDSLTWAVDEDNQLAGWFLVKDSLNHRFVSVAENLWQFGCSGDEAVLDDYNKQQAWHGRCEKVLTDCYLATHANDNRQNTAKADSMLNEIERFFEEDADESTMGMVVQNSLLFRFQLFRMVGKTKELLRKDGQMKDETLAWNELHQALNEFCSYVVQTELFGGSAAGLVMLSTKNEICSCRVEDLKRMLQGKGNATASRLVAVKNEFLKAVENLSDIEDSSEDMKSYMDEENIKEYRRVYGEMKKAKVKLVKVVDKWLNTRKDYGECTLKALHDLTVVVKNTHMGD